MRPQWLAQKESELKIMGSAGRAKNIGLFDTTDQRYYSVMRFEEGRELAEVSNLKNRPYAERLTMALKAAFDIRLLHQDNIVHADIKAKNFVYTQNTSAALGIDNRATVVDFGFALKVPKGQEFVIGKEFVGTKEYMAPEIKKGSLRYSFASDIYALGVMYTQDLGVDLDICDAMQTRNYDLRPQMSAIIKALAEELKKQPEDQLDEKARELIRIYDAETYQEKTNTAEPEKVAIDNAIKEFRKFLGNDKKYIVTVLDNDKEDSIKRAIALKGYLLIQKQNLGSFSNKKRQEIGKMIKNLNQISRKISFMDDAVCIKHYQSLVELDKQKRLEDMAKKYNTSNNFKFFLNSKNIDVDKKATALKGFLLSQKKPGIFLSPEQKEIRSAIAEIDTISEKAKLCGNGCVAIYNNSINSQKPDMLIQSHMNQSTLSAARKPKGVIPSQPDDPNNASKNNKNKR